MPSALVINGRLQVNRPGTTGGEAVVAQDEAEDPDDCTCCENEASGGIDLCHVSCAAIPGESEYNTSWGEGAADPTKCCVPLYLDIEINFGGAGCKCVSPIYVANAPVPQPGPTGLDPFTSCEKGTGSFDLKGSLVNGGLQNVGLYDPTNITTLTKSRTAFVFRGVLTNNGDALFESYGVDFYDAESQGECEIPYFDGENGPIPLVCQMEQPFAFVWVYLFPPDIDNPSWALASQVWTCGSLTLGRPTIDVTWHAPAPDIDTSRVHTGDYRIPAERWTTDLVHWWPKPQDISPCQDEYVLEGWSGGSYTFPDAVSGGTGSGEFGLWTGGSITIKPGCTLQNAPLSVLCPNCGADGGTVPLPTHKWYEASLCSGGIGGTDLWWRDDTGRVGFIYKHDGLCYYLAKTGPGYEDLPGEQIDFTDEYTSCLTCFEETWLEAYDCVTDAATGKYVLFETVSGNIGDTFTYAWPDPAHPCVKFSGPQISTTPDPGDILEAGQLYANCTKCSGFVQALLCEDGTALNAWTEAINVETLGYDDPDVGNIYRIIYEGLPTCVYYGLPVPTAGGTIIDPIANFDSCEECEAAENTPCEELDCDDGSITVSISFSSPCDGESWAINTAPYFGTATLDSIGECHWQWCHDVSTESCIDITCDGDEWVLNFGDTAGCGGVTFEYRKARTGEETSPSPGGWSFESKSSEFCCEEGNPSVSSS